MSITAFSEFCESFQNIIKAGSPWGTLHKQLVSEMRGILWNAPKLYNYLLVCRVAEKNFLSFLSFVLCTSYAFFLFLKRIFYLSLVLSNKIMLLALRLINFFDMWVYSSNQFVLFSNFLNEIFFWLPFFQFYYYFLM